MPFRGRLLLRDIARCRCVKDVIETSWSSAGLPRQRARQTRVPRRVEFDRQLEQSFDHLLSHSYTASSCITTSYITLHNTTMAHVRKRQFQPSSQPSIKSFFTTVGTSSAPASADIDEYSLPLKPTVPDHVQSLLINVGMRVRKSVPEGYKTHKSLPVPTITNMHPASIPQHSSADLPTSSAPELYSKPSELAPFCGLHKIGGFSSQPTSSAPGLSYTQSTIASSISTPQTPQTNTRKRSYADDMEAELDSFFDDEQDQHDSMLDNTASPKPKYPLSHSSMPDLSAKAGIVSPQSRPKARMKTRSPHKLLHDFSDEDVGFLQPMDCE